MAILRAPAKETKKEAPKKHRIGIKISELLLEKMKDYHRPKEKSEWIEEAVIDLLERQIYIDADWVNINDDAESFFSLLSLKESQKKSKNETILMSDGAVQKLNKAVTRISNAFPHAGQGIKPAIIRAAIKQKIILRGCSLKQIED